MIDNDGNCSEIIMAINESLGDKKNIVGLFTEEGVVESVREIAPSVSEVAILNGNERKIIKTNKPKTYWIKRTKALGKKVIIKGKSGEGTGSVCRIDSVRIASIVNAINSSTDDNRIFYFKAMRELNDLSSSQIDKLDRSLNELEDFSAESDGVDVALFESFDLMCLKANTLKGKYSKESWANIKQSMDSYARVDNDEKARIRKRMAFDIEYISGVKKSVLEKKPEEIRKELDRFPGQRMIKDTLCRLFDAYQRHPLHKAPKLLIEDGRGRDIESLVELFFELTGMPVERFNAAGMDDIASIIGSSSVYTNCTIGEFGKLLSRVGSGGIIIQYLDKVGKKEIVPAFQSIVNGRYKNELLGRDVDVNSVWRIFTVAKSDDVNLDKSIMTVLPAAEYSKEEMVKMVDWYIVLFCKENGIEENKLVISDEVKWLIANEYARDSNALNVKEILYSILQQARLKCKEDTICISKDNLSDFFDLLLERDYYRETYVSSVSEIEKKYVLCNKEMASAIRTKVSALLDEYKLADEDSKDALEKRIIPLGNFLDREVEFDEEAISRALDEKIYGMENVKIKILDQICSYENRDDFRFVPILLIGPSGVGKSSFADALSKGLDIPIVSIAGNQISTAEEVMGASREYGKNASTGLLGKLTSPDKSSSPALVKVDEIDKITDKSILNVFYNLFDRQLAYNNYFECEYPTNKLLFICTANDIHSIPYTLRNRCAIIQVDSYSLSERMHIAEEYIVPRTLRQYSMENRISFPTSILEYILKKYTYTTSVREIEECIETIATRVKRMSKSSGTEKFEVDESFVKKCLGAPAYGRDRCPVGASNSNGVARALAVNSSGGCTFGIEVCENPFGPELEITGLAKDSFLESVKVAISVAARLLNEEIKNVHVHALDAGVQKDGPSAGVTICAALLSMKLKQPLGNVAFSGELTLGGQIQSIGGVREKLNAAEMEGTEIVYIPYDNWMELLDEGIIQNYSLDIIPVKSIEELSHHLFPEEHFENSLLLAERG